MHKLNKGPEPGILRERSEEWNAAYAAAANVSQRRAASRWGHPEIRTALDRETSSRCAYCESSMGDVSYPNVDHLFPKSVYPTLSHTWANLTVACEKCNRSKSDHDPRIDPIVLPYDVDISEQIIVRGCVMTWVAGSARGERTIQILRLNRSELLIERARRVESAARLLERWVSATGDAKVVAQAAIVIDYHEGDYPSAVRDYLLSRDFPLDELPY